MLRFHASRRNSERSHNRLLPTQPSLVNDGFSTGAAEKYLGGFSVLRSEPQEKGKFNQHRTCHIREDLRKATKLLLAELAIVLVVAGAIAYVLVLPSASYHFRELKLNIYPNGVVDFSADMTTVVRALSILALLTMLIGLLVGTAMGLSSLNLSRTARTIGKDAVDNSVQLLLKSGFVRKVATEQGTNFEITDTGVKFLREYQRLNAIEDQLRIKQTANSP